MGELWRRKKYYEPRVLLQTEDVLTPLFGDSFVCLTGGQLYCLRNLAQYLHRRSTFVSSYEDGYYLAPTTEEWDALQAIVADLEDKLMGCTEVETLLEQIAACVCASAGNDWPAGGTLEGQRDYDDYESSVEYDVGDPPEEFEDWDEWTEYKCKAAQRVVDDISSLGEKLEVVYSTGAVVTFSVFQYMVLGTAIAPPVALALTIIAALAAAGTALAMIAFQQWCDDNKDEIVCCIHNADTEGEAYAAVQAYIDANWDLVVGIPFGKALFSHDVISKCYDGGLNVSGYSAAYCQICEGPQLFYSWDFPPDTDWDVSAEGVYYDGAGVMHWDAGSGSVDAISPTFVGLDVGGYTMLAVKTGRAPDANCVLKIDSSPDAENWTERWSQQQGSGSAARCIAIGNHSGQINWLADWTYLRFRIRNRVNDAMLDICTLDITFTPQ